MQKKAIKGNKAPDFCLNNEDEKNVCLKDLKGKIVVLYFYPKDDTPGCTIEAKEFTKENPDFEGLDAVILGVSADDCGSHKSFIKKQNLKITLLSDPDKKVIKAYGVWQKKQFMGRELMGIARTTFLIGRGGKIEYVWEKVRPEGHAKEVMAKINEINK
jgi:peroxiredoxin Q/BCP